MVYSDGDASENEDEDIAVRDSYHVLKLDSSLHLKILLPFF
jgi:hypothetical protein